MTEFTLENAIEYRDNYKTFGGFKYHLNFPDEWITCEYPLTGRECANCVGVDGDAMWRGMIIGYCVSCAATYDGKRGPGFLGCGVESPLENAVSAYRLYLGDLALEEPENDVEDIDDYDKHAECSRLYWQQTYVKEKLDLFDQFDDYEYEDEYPEYELEDEPICCMSNCKKYAECDSQYCYTHLLTKKQPKTSTK